MLAAYALTRSLPLARRFGIARSAQADTDALTLWYTRPAAQWIDALRIGNGRLGAMVFGGGARNPARETLQLNEDTLWSDLLPAIPSTWPSGAVKVFALAAQSPSISAGRTVKLWPPLSVLS